jgi:DNA sulfur modification protein DndD
MIIKSVELNNFRIYGGTNVIDLSVTDQENIIIVSGKNGYGKTTFLMSLVWCLYGKQMEDVDDIYKNEIKHSGNYPKYITASLNLLEARNGSTKFSVSVTFIGVKTIPDITCNELKITRTYHTEPKIKEDIEVLIDGMENDLVEEVGSDIFIRDYIMPKEIAKFFFFDAEKIVSLAEIHTQEQRKRLSEAYIEVLGIKKYQDLKNDLGNYLQKLIAKTASDEERKKLDDAESENNRIKDKNIKIEKDIRKLDEASNILKRDIDKLQERLIKQGNTISVNELNKLRKDKEGLDDEVECLGRELASQYEIIPFAIAGELLSQTFDQVLDERKTVSRDFGKGELINVTENIIDDLTNLPKPEALQIKYQIQEFYVENLRIILKKHLEGESSQEEKSVTILHNFSEAEKSELEQFIKNISLTFKEKFKNINKNFIGAKNKLEEIKRIIRDAERKEESPLIAADIEKKEKLEKEQQEKIETIGGLKKDLENNKGLLLKNDNAIKKISDEIGLGRENQKIGEEVETTIGILEKFISDFKQSKATALSKRIKESVDTLFHKNKKILGVSWGSKKSFVEKVEVEIIGEDIDIHLFDAKDNKINKESLSKGEQQLYATAILKGLVDESNIDFPVFIDSPMQKLDVDHAKNIIENFYPNVSKQVIIFPLLEKEMTKEEYDLLQKSISKTYLIRNNDNENSSFEEVEKTKLFEIFKSVEQV